MGSKRQDSFPFSENVTFQIQTGQTGLKQFFLPYTANLVGKVIIGVEGYSVTATPVTPSGQTVINATDFSESFLTIVDARKVERLRTQPLATLLRANNNGNYIALDDIPIDVQKSYFTYGGTNALVANETYMLTFYYRDPTEAELQQMSRV